MKNFIIFKATIIIAMLFLNNTCVKAQLYSDSISINFFLIDECRISENMTSEINYLKGHFDSPQFNYHCYFPSQSSTEKKISKFVKNYNINISCDTDHDKLKTKFYGATVAPEVVVYDEKNQKLIYRGRINNSFAEVGKRRHIISSYDLRIVLEDVLNQKKVNVVETQAIGCYIN